MIKISIELAVYDNNGDSINLEETGETLENMNLKKDIKGEILRILNQYKMTAGKCHVDLLIEKDGEYYDHDEIIIDVNDDFTDLTFLN